jgi:adenylate cyclase
MLYPEKEDNKSDSELAKTLQIGGNRIVLAQGFDVPVVQKEKPVIPAPDYVIDSAFMEVMDMKLGRSVLAEEILPPVPELGKNITLGHVYNLKDIDGKTRWEVLYLKYDEDFYPSFALQTARIALGLPQDEMTLYAGRGIGLGKTFIHFEPHGGKMLTNYLGKEHTFTYISASDVLLNRFSPDTFKNKIVFLGTSAIATYDLMSTPFSANMPGVEKNATVVENIINQRFLTKSPGTIEAFIIVATGLLFGLALSRLKALWASFISFSAIFFYLTLLLILFTYKGVWINMTYPTVNMFLIFTSIMVTKYFREEKKAKEIRGLFSSYVSPKIVEELLNDPEKVRLGGERKTITVLFTDIRGFTKISEKRSPEEVVTILNEYFTEMADSIFRWDGTLDKFVGDAIMAFWGAPLEQPNHAELAVRCALDMSDKLSRLKEKWKTEGKEILDCGIGINSGDVVIGNIGALGKKMDYTAIGDPVNLCSRIEALTKEYNTRIIITEFTMEYIKPLVRNKKLGHLEFNEIGSVKVKGKESEVRIFGLKSLS